MQAHRESCTPTKWRLFCGSLEGTKGMIKGIQGTARVEVSCYRAGGYDKAWTQQQLVLAISVKKRKVSIFKNGFSNNGNHSYQ